MFKVLSNYSLTFILSLFLGLSSYLQAETAEDGEFDSRSGWVWRSHFLSTQSIVSSMFLANEDTVTGAGNSCISADDFVVGTDSIWEVDTLKAFMFWSGKAPDRIQVLIWPDAGGEPSADSVIHNFTFIPEMPVENAKYALAVGVKDQNIVLGPGVYWISFIGVYDTIGFFNVPENEKAETRWERSTDFVLGLSGMSLLDSIGYYLPVHPFPWWEVAFNNEDIKKNSAKFWIKADVQTSIHSNGFQRSRSLVSVFPNPAAEQVLFQFNNTSVRQVEIYDMKGKLIKTVSVKAENLKVDIGSFTNGVYFYNIVDKLGMLVDRGTFSVSR